MNLESQFQRYPTLKELFWPSAKGIKYQPENPHPLIALVLSNDSRASDVAIRTDKCCQLVKDQNQDWIRQRVDTIIGEEDFSNASAALGEIRAFGELIWVWRQKVTPGKFRNDFTLEVDGIIVRIEVNTPQHRTKRHTLEHKSFESERIKGSILEVFPFGQNEKLTIYKEKLFLNWLPSNKKNTSLKVAQSISFG